MKAEIEICKTVKMQSEDYQGYTLVAYEHQLIRGQCIRILEVEAVAYFGEKCDRSETLEQWVKRVYPHPLRQFFASDDLPVS